MKQLPHLYEVTLKDGPGGYVTVSAGGPPELRMAPPVEFDGPGDAWSPEQLLVASVESCFLFTLRAVAGKPSSATSRPTSPPRDSFSARMASFASRKSSRDQC